jgi:hypothetical protein
MFRDKTAGDRTTDQPRESLSAFGGPESTVLSSEPREPGFQGLL